MKNLLLFKKKFTVIYEQITKTFRQLALLLKTTENITNRRSNNKANYPILIFDNFQKVSLFGF